MANKKHALVQENSHKPVPPVQQLPEVALIAIWVVLLAVLFFVFKRKDEKKPSDPGNDSEDFSHKGKSIVFWHTTGEVLDTNKFSETHVSSSGGGGYVGQHGGYVSAPSVHSSSVTNHEFWMKTNSGNEIAIKLTDVDIPVRVGQKITMISAGQTTDKGWYSVLVNHNLKRHWTISSADELNRYMSIESFPGWYKALLHAAWVIFILIIISNSSSPVLSFFLVSSFIITWWILKRSSVTSMVEKLKLHLEVIAQAAYDKN